MHGKLLWILMVISGLWFLPNTVDAASKLTYSGHTGDFIETLTPGKRDITIPTIDISNETQRHVIIAQGTEDIRQGHANTVLMADGQTMFVVWTLGHGGPVRFLKKSTDGGLSWSDLLDVPDNWPDHRNCPVFYRLADPGGKERVFVFASGGPEGGGMYQARTEDEGNTWSLFEPTSLNDSNGVLSAGMPFTAIEPVKDSNELIGITNIRRPGEGYPTTVVVQSRSLDGGLTWSDWKIILDLVDPLRPCEPDIIRSPDGKQLLMIIRENERSFNSWIMLSDDEGKTWSNPFQATASVTMNRHQHQYTPDGRLVVVGRDAAIESPTRKHFVAWVGTYEDLATGKEGQYRVKLLPHQGRGSVEYPSIELLPDGTLLAVDSVRYRPGENYSVVSTRFTIDELDQKYEALKKK